MSFVRRLYSLFAGRLVSCGSRLHIHFPLHRDDDLQEGRRRTTPAQEVVETNQPKKGVEMGVARVEFWGLLTISDAQSHDKHR